MYTSSFNIKAEGRRCLIKEGERSSSSQAKVTLEKGLNSVSKRGRSRERKLQRAVMKHMAFNSEWILLQKKIHINPRAIDMLETGFMYWNQILFWKNTDKLFQKWKASLDESRQKHLNNVFKSSLFMRTQWEDIWESHW